MSMWNNTFGPSIFGKGGEPPTELVRRETEQREAYERSLTPEVRRELAELMRDTRGHKPLRKY